MNRPPPSDVPAGAAVMPQVPEEVGVHPLLLTALHAIVFLQGSDETVVAPAAADEQLELIAGCLQRLEGADLQRVREDLVVLSSYAKEQRWPKNAEQFYSNFLADFGIGRQAKK
jgi:hypothetical protein